MRDFENVKSEIYEAMPWFDEVIERCQERIDEINNYDDFKDYSLDWASGPEDWMYLFYEASKNDVELTPDDWNTFDKVLGDIELFMATPKEPVEEVFEKHYFLQKKLVARDAFVGTTCWEELKKVEQQIDDAKKAVEENEYKSPYVRKELDDNVIRLMAKKAAIQDWMDDRHIPEKEPEDNDVDSYADLELKGKGPENFHRWMNSMRSKGYY